MTLDKERAKILKEIIENDKLREYFFTQGQMDLNGAVRNFTGSDAIVILDGHINPYVDGLSIHHDVKSGLVAGSLVMTVTDQDPFFEEDLNNKAMDMYILYIREDGHALYRKISNLEINGESFAHDMNGLELLSVYDFEAESITPFLKTTIEDFRDSMIKVYPHLKDEWDVNVIWGEDEEDSDESGDE